MKKLIVMLLCCSLLALPALGEDLAVLSDDELTQLRDRISLELASRSVTADGILGSWDANGAHVELLSVTRGTTDDGRPGLDCCFRWTNTGTDVGTFRAKHWVTLYHDGVECPTTIRLDGRLVNNDTWGMKVFPGRTLQEMHWFFVLTGTEDTVVIEIEDRSARTRSAGFVTVALP